MYLVPLPATTAPPSPTESDEDAAERRLYAIVNDRGLYKQLWDSEIHITPITAGSQSIEGIIIRAPKRKQGMLFIAIHSQHDTPTARRAMSFVKTLARLVRLARERGISLDLQGRGLRGSR